MKDGIYIIYNSLRYGNSEKFPNRIISISTLEQALALTEYMSNYYPGQEGMWLVQGHEDD